jgi:hypothetical protein
MGGPLVLAAAQSLDGVSLGFWLGLSEESHHGQSEYETPSADARLGDSMGVPSSTMPSGAVIVRLRPDWCG